MVHETCVTCDLSFVSSSRIPFSSYLSLSDASFPFLIQNHAHRMSRDADHASTSAVVSETDSRWLKFKSKCYDCFWDFEAELADWFGLNTSKFYEELEMKKDLEREEEEERLRKERKEGVEMAKMEMAGNANNEEE